MRPALRFPEDVKDFFSRKFRNGHREWLTGGGAWPMLVPLGAPTEVEASLQLASVRDWVAAWTTWKGPGELLWTDRRWRMLGLHNLPDKLVVPDPATLATWIGEEQRWERACSRYKQLLSRWPTLASRLPRYFDSLADYPDPDLQRLVAFLSWIERHPHSNLYPRQLPIAGMDTKWLEPRMPLVADLVSGLRTADPATGDFHELCGLKRSPPIVRLRLLDPALRLCTGGLGDISAPLGEVANLRLPVARVYIVENVQTGLCFGDRAASAVVLGLGYGVALLSQIPWLREAECIYWGDLDTHGFAILHTARACLPHVASILMDERTLLANRDLWTAERERYHAADLPMLTAAEQNVYQGLKQQRWGWNVRLEQERIAWNEAWEALCGIPNA